MESIDKWRWITLFEYFQCNPFESPEETLTNFPNQEHRDEYQLNDQVSVKQEGLHWLIGPGEEGGKIIHKKKITDEDLSNFYQDQLKMFKPAFIPTLDRVFAILKRMYLNRTVYCVQLNTIWEDGSDLFFTLPWPFPREFENSVIPEHGDPELRFIHYTSYILCI